MAQHPKWSLRDTNCIIFLQKSSFKFCIHLKDNTCFLSWIAKWYLLQFLHHIASVPTLWPTLVFGVQLASSHYIRAPVLVFFLTTQLKRDTISLSAMSPYFNPLSSFYHCTKMCLVSLHLLDLNPLWVFGFVYLFVCFTVSGAYLKYSKSLLLNEGMNEWLLSEKGWKFRVKRENVHTLNK